jgi:hypothetical protein
MASTLWIVVAEYNTMSPAGSFTRCEPEVAPITSSPPSYSSGPDRNKVADRSVRTG